MSRWSHGCATFCNRRLQGDGRMRRLLNRLLRDESGATAMEYGLMIALIAIALITALTAISGRLTATFDTIRTTLGG